jgi:hypothetical protein
MTDHEDFVKKIEEASIACMKNLEKQMKPLTEVIYCISHDEKVWSYGFPSYCHHPDHKINQKEEK